MSLIRLEDNFVTWFCHSTFKWVLGPELGWPHMHLPYSCPLSMFIRLVHVLPCISSLFCDHIISYLLINSRHLGCFYYLGGYYDKLLWTLKHKCYMNILYEVLRLTIPVFIVRSYGNSVSNLAKLQTLSQSLHYLTSPSALYKSPSLIRFSPAFVLIPAN